MKLSRKNLGRVATTFLATAMLASLTAVPAMATDGVQGSTNETISTVQITKELTMPNDVVTSENMTFNFTLSGATATDETIVSDNVTLDVTSGTGTAAGTATFEAGVANGATQTVTFDISDFTFNAPGVYKYTIDEQALDDSSDYTDVTESLTVYLFVKDTNGDTAGGYAPYAAVVKNSDGTTKTETWENSYLTAATNQLTVNKVIAGDMASTNDVFSFTVSGLTGGRTYTLAGTNITDENDTVIAEENGTVTFTLKGGESWTIKGLVEGTYTVTEAPNNEGYTLTSMTNDTDDTTDGAQVDVDGTNDETTFTNTRNAVSPTGIVTNIAPYALLVVIAAAGCFVFLRKRNED